MQHERSGRSLPAHPSRRLTRIALGSLAVALRGTGAPNIADAAPTALARAVQRDEPVVLRFLEAHGFSFANPVRATVAYGPFDGLALSGGRIEIGASLPLAAGALPETLLHEDLHETTTGGAGVPETPSEWV